MPTNPLADFNPAAFDVVITCADGLDHALLMELDSFGLAGSVLRAGRVAVSLSLSQFYQLCLYSRVASRILLPLGEYRFSHRVERASQSRDVGGKKTTRTIETKVIDEDIPAALYAFASGVDWTAIFDVQHSFAIRLSVDKRLSVNQQFATLRIKDAVADCFNARLGRRPDVAKNPDFLIYAHASTELAELYLDLSGTSLHRRGYRVANTAAPLKENLAAALLYECGWHTGVHDALIDPMCGSGTFITEALLMRTNYPVGIDKATSEFGFYQWAHHDEALWQTSCQQAMDKFYANLNQLEKDLKHHAFAVIATDADASAVRACHKNLLSSGLAPIADDITFAERSLSQLPPLLVDMSAKNPLIITNPPYGERLGERDFIKPLYHGLGLIIADGCRRAGVPQASMAVLASHVEHADTLPLLEPKTLKCHNGALTVYFRHGQMVLSPKNTLIDTFEKRDIINDESQEFINRLQKNLSHLKKLATKNHVSNLRIYDADLPNYNVAIDLYGDKIHVQEYAPPKQIPADVAKDRFNQVLSAVREIFQAQRESIFIKTRAKQSGNEQYTKNQNSDKHKKLYVAKENGAYFYVNFTDYLDTGLFIDHRNMRALIKENSRAKKVLNLFAYTCTASVHAAMGGATSVTSVDLSDNYLDWGRANFALNGLDLTALTADGLDKYQFIAADVFEWIKNHTEQYDVIFIDPPTFSNSKKFKGTFDVQRDHVALINRAMNRLSPDGVLYFSNNFSKFILDDTLTHRYDIQNITDKTIGFDFNIKKPIHQSFIIRHKNGKKSPMADEVHHDIRAADKQKSTEMKNPQGKNTNKPADKKPPFKKYGVKKTGLKPNNDKKSRSNDAPSKPTQKIRYDKIDGKMVATVISDESANQSTTKNQPKKYQIKKPNS